MAEAANKGKMPSNEASVPSLQEAARAKAAALKKAFEKGNGRPATPAQLSEAKGAMERFARIEEWISERLNVLAFYPTDKYDLHSEKTRMCVALYILKNIKEISEAAKEDGSSPSYSLFLSTAKAAEEVFYPPYFLNMGDADLVGRFMKVQPYFEACASAFGTSSLGIQEVQKQFSFRLGGLVNERRKVGLR